MTIMDDNEIMDDNYGWKSWMTIMDDNYDNDNLYNDNHGWQWQSWMKMTIMYDNHGWLWQ